MEKMSMLNESSVHPSDTAIGNLDQAIDVNNTHVNGHAEPSKCNAQLGTRDDVVRKNIYR